MNLVSLLVERAGMHPDRPALVDRFRGEDRVVSYGELSRRAAAGAEDLQQMGLKRGQSVLVFQPVSIELFEFLLAAFHAGLQVMLADPSAGRPYLSLCCQRLVPAAFFGSWKAQCLRLMVEEMRDIGISICSEGWFPGAKSWRTDSAGAPMVETDDDEAALVTFTSGSTGRPKAAVRSHGFLLGQHRALSKALDFEDGEVDLITLPVFVLANLASGLTSILAATDLSKPGSPDVAAVTAQCGKFHVTRCSASPAFFDGFLKSAAGIPAFEKVFTGGAPVFPDLLRRLRMSLPDARIHAVYGSTEAEPIAHFQAEHANRDTDSMTLQGGGLCAGKPIPEIDLRIISDQWGKPLGPLNEVDLQKLSVTDGQAGEIIVSGDHVLGGYLDGLGDEETKIRVGGRIWHRTGDAGWLDAQGRVWLLGRCAEKLPGGAPCYPFAVECALREIFPEIRMAALGWKGRRTLVVGTRCDMQEAAAVESSAARFDIGDVIYVESIPLDHRHNAKIDYPALRGVLQG